MIEIGVFHNGASDLPVKKAPDGLALTDGDLRAMHESNQRIVLNQVRQGILAEHLGFDYWFQTEHHFQPEGVEFSPNPLVVEAAIAARTRRIRLGQLANITPWWDPIRLAEQAAMLDVISGGRLEFGIGRGYQSREAEVLGRPFGATVQDQQRNRAYFEEAYEIILKAWTEPSFSHRGEFFTIPPSYTLWNHDQTIAYFTQPGVGRRVDEVLNIGEPTGNSMPIYARSTTLREISVFPQPLQKPYPQIWQPVTSPRSSQWAARHGVNGVYVESPDEQLRRDLEIYFDEAERTGWPDRLNRGRPKFGWDSEMRRGVAMTRQVHIAEKGIGDLRRAELALEHTWHYLYSFGFGSFILGPEEELSDPRRLTAEALRSKGIALFGSIAYITDRILELKEKGGYEDFNIIVHFEVAGFRSEEIEEQMQCFAEEIMPVLRRECGGSPTPSESSVTLPDLHEELATGS